MKRKPNHYQDAFEVIARTDRSIPPLQPRARQVIEAVCAVEHPMTIPEIAKAIAIDPSGVSRLVMQLSDQGLVTREIKPEDKRKTLVSPTKTARAIDARVRETAAA